MDSKGHAIIPQHCWKESEGRQPVLQSDRRVFHVQFFFFFFLVLKGKCIKFNAPPRQIKYPKKSQKTVTVKYTHVAIEREHSTFAFFIYSFAVDHLAGATKFDYSQLNLTTQQPARSPSRVEKVVGMSPSGRTTWLTGGRGRHQPIL